MSDLQDYNPYAPSHKKPVNMQNQQINQYPKRKKKRWDFWDIFFYASIFLCLTELAFILMFADEANHYKDEYWAIHTENSQLNDEIIQLNKKISTYENQLIECGEQLTEKQKTIDAQNEIIRKKNTEIASNNAKTQVAQQEETNVVNNIMEIKKVNPAVIESGDIEEYDGKYVEITGTLSFYDDNTYRLYSGIFKIPGEIIIINKNDIVKTDNEKIYDSIYNYSIEGTYGARSSTRFCTARGIVEGDTLKEIEIYFETISYEYEIDASDLLAEMTKIYNSPDYTGFDNSDIKKYAYKYVRIKGVIGENIHETVSGITMKIDDTMIRITDPDIEGVQVKQGEYFKDGEYIDIIGYFRISSSQSAYGFQDHVTIYFDSGLY